MGDPQELLNIVDEAGNIIGEATRERIHKEGLLHREISVWFYTPKNEIIFQLRSANKDTHPNLLDGTVGGHVGLGDNFEDATLREIFEETGLKVKLDELKICKITHDDASDDVTHTRNHVLKNIYVYLFKGALLDLTIEEGNSQGFEAWPLERLKNLSPTDAARFIPGMLEGLIPMLEKVGIK